MASNVAGQGTAQDPWLLKTPPGTSDYTMHKDEASDPPRLVCTVGKTTLYYQLRCLDDLHAMLREVGDWVELGSADEQKPAKGGTVEAWGRSASNPVGGWYGLKKGLRGRFGMYVPPLMEALGLAEVEHNARGNRMRAIWELVNGSSGPRDRRAVSGSGGLASCGSAGRSQDVEVTLRGAPQAVCDRFELARAEPALFIGCRRGLEGELAGPELGPEPGAHLVGRRFWQPPGLRGSVVKRRQRVGGDAAGLIPDQQRTANVVVPHGCSLRAPQGHDRVLRQAGGIGPVLGPCRAAEPGDVFNGQVDDERDL